MDELLDTPVSLSYNNGKVSPSNVVFMGYIILPVSLFMFLMGSYILGSIALVLSVFIAFTTYGTVIDPEEKKIREYTAYLGFIKVYKSYSYANFQYLTIIPSKKTTTMNMRMINTISHTDYLQGICILNKNYRNKKELTRFPQKSLALDVAKKLTNIMDLEYFEYDPQIIRQHLIKNR